MKDRTYKMAATSQIFLKTTTGRTIVMDISPATTIGDVKAYYLAREHLPLHYQRVTFGTKQLDRDSTLLTEAGVNNEATLHILLRVHGHEALPMGPNVNPQIGPATDAK